MFLLETLNLYTKGRNCDFKITSQQIACNMTTENITCWPNFSQQVKNPRWTWQRSVPQAMTIAPSCFCPQQLVSTGQMRLCTQIQRAHMWRPGPQQRGAAPTLLPEPSLLVRVEESVHEVIAVIFRDLEGLLLDAVIQALRHTHTCKPLSHTSQPTR